MIRTTSLKLHLTGSIIQFKCTSTSLQFINLYHMFLAQGLFVVVSSRYTKRQLLENLGDTIHLL